jgi:pyrimidine oxygenase
MGLWPGNAYFGYRYDYATEYVQVMKELWANGKSDFKGKYFSMEDCKMSPTPSTEVKIVAAGQSGRGLEFASQYADYNCKFYSHSQLAVLDDWTDLSSNKSLHGRRD